MAVGPNDTQQGDKQVNQGKDGKDTKDHSSEGGRDPKDTIKDGLDAIDKANRH